MDCRPSTIQELAMTYPPDHHRDSIRGLPLEHDQDIVSGSILALTAFAIVVCGITWYAVTGHRTGTVSINAPAFESLDSTVGYGAQSRPRAPERAPAPVAK
jgi:hypothetical protein